MLIDDYVLKRVADLAKKAADTGDPEDLRAYLDARLLQATPPGDAAGMEPQVVQQMNDSKVDRCGHPKFYTMLDGLAKLHSRKNSDYATADEPLSNLKACEKLIIACPSCKHKFRLPAWVGVIIRLMDKWDRIVRLVPKIMSGQEPAVAGESIKDTLNDNAVYSLLDIILIEESHNDTSRPEV